jgi:hypothetical protein
MDVRRRWRRTTQRQAFDERDELGRHPLCPLIATSGRRERDEATAPARREPAMSRACGHTRRPRRVNHSHTVLEVRSQHLKAPLRPVALYPGELAQRDHDRPLRQAASALPAGG